MRSKKGEMNSTRASSIMQGITCCMLWWLLSFVSHGSFSWSCVSGASCGNYCSSVCNETFSSCCMRYTTNILDGSTQTNPAEALMSLEKILEETPVKGVINISSGNFVALLFKPTGSFTGLEIYASDNEAGLSQVPKSKVHVQLPSTLNIGQQDKIVFSLFKLPETNGTDAGVLYDVYDRRLVILSVQGKQISGLKDPVNITINFKDINKTQEPSCQFFNFSTNNFSTDGCHTRWTDGQSNVTCSCDHFTYFGVLMTSPSVHVSKKEIEILAYISVIGCSVSLFTLIITVLLFITNRTLRKDVSMNIHINLVIALILLNLHFLPSQAVAAHPSTWLCFYMALALHYSLLATFTWMALEGFHLYLLLVKIFNISVSRYILKLSVVGWGVPAVIVSVVVIIDRGFYGHVPLDRSNYDDTKICYISNETVKAVTTTGLFTMVFLFNMIMFMVTVKRVLNVGYNKELRRKNAKQAIFPLLGVCALLGITWGLVFFSFSNLTNISLYLFCLLNSLQGFFIFLWFVCSLRRLKKSAEATSSSKMINSK
ncbi:adhesion G-protein coupled receptor G2-like [Haplochromis burtoni]|uniref:adhesion G-protein coupled receptor G2-like n=1 Tax=Haplochromis burtoni TaxID=8153 RepID=UPI001C2DA0EA|nr:adhesion G-protein coupled receptor G2-like [Haplochromis burtoni]